MHVFFQTGLTVGFRAQWQMKQMNTDFTNTK